MKNKIAKNHIAFRFAILIAPFTLALSSCQHFGQFGQNTKNDMERYWMRTTQTLPIDRTPEPTIDSSDPKRFIHRDGSGTAIPAKGDFDLYISPFAPSSGYVQSKRPVGSVVRCPYSGRKLILGDRNVIAERELP